MLLEGRDHILPTLNNLVFKALPSVFNSLAQLSGYPKGFPCLS